MPKDDSQTVTLVCTTMRVILCGRAHGGVVYIPNTREITTLSKLRQQNQGLKIVTKRLRLKRSG
jgi:hypothetical protein